MRLPSFVLALLFLAPPVSPAVASSDEDWATIEPNPALVFPRDHGSHPDTKIEWWYVTGQVEDGAGRRFGFQFTVFRSGNTPLREGGPAPGGSPLRAHQVFAGHLAVSDVDSRKTTFADRLRRDGLGLARSSTQDLDLVLEDWSLVRDDGDRLVLHALDPSGIGLELTLRPEKPLVRHGLGGYSRKGEDPDNASTYLSWTRLAASGRLTADGTAREVTGLAWFDHEFGTSVLGEGVVGWDWFGLHLDDGRDLMLFRLRTEEGGSAAVSAGTLVAPDGSTRSLARSDFTIEPRGTWTSPRTGAHYPAGFTLSVPAEGLRLEVTPLVPDSELATGDSTGVVYWEGPVELTGTATGRGYGELTGYAGTMAGRF